jgi:hypothetical protein
MNDKRRGRYGVGQEIRRTRQACEGGLWRAEREVIVFFSDRILVDDGHQEEMSSRKEDVRRVRSNKGGETIRWGVTHISALLSLEQGFSHSQTD